MTLAFRAVSGSRLSGLSVEGSDQDFLEVRVGTTLQYCGVMEVSEAGQVNADGVDVRVYDLRKFARLLMAGNYTCLSSLYAPVESVEFCHPAFFELLRSRRHFVGQNAVMAALGQAKGDFHRMTEHGFDAKTAARALFLVHEAQTMLLKGDLDVKASTLPLAVRAGRILEPEFRVVFMEGLERANALMGESPVGTRKADPEFVSQLVAGVVFKVWGFV